MDMERIRRIIFGAIILLWVDILPTVFSLDKKSEGCLPAGLLSRSEEYAKLFRPSGYLSLQDFSQLLKDLQMNFQSAIILSGVENKCKDLDLNDSELEQSGDSSRNCSQNQEKCPSISTIYLRHSDNTGLNYTQLPSAVLEALLSARDPNCLHETPRDPNKYKPNIGQAWGYGIGFVSLIVIISSIGGLLTPLMSKTFFQRLLQFLVAMAAGTLVGTGLLVLIPEAFNLISCAEVRESYIWKSLTTLVSIYIFFMSERILKCFLRDREAKHLRLNENFEESRDTEEEGLGALVNGLADHSHSHLPTPSLGKEMSSEGGKKNSPVKTVAWMVLTGDIIHNFVDGMTIGASFTQNVYMGVTISIAVLCEELPHELGDIAILIASGMTMKRALFLNFLSACVCYLGLVTGTILGETTDANRWILAVAGGVFLYVPLVDMLPDMSQTLDEQMRDAFIKTGRMLTRDVKLLVFVQGLGLILGMCIILVVLYFSTSIQIN